MSKTKAIILIKKEIKSLVTTTQIETIIHLMKEIIKWTLKMKAANIMTKVMKTSQSPNQWKT
jgi:hypothetical protein